MQQPYHCRQMFKEDQQYRCNSSSNSYQNNNQFIKKQQYPQQVADQSSRRVFGQELYHNNNINSIGFQNIQINQSNKNIIGQKRTSVQTESDVIKIYEKKNIPHPLPLKEQLATYRSKTPDSYDCGMPIIQIKQQADFIMREVKLRRETLESQEDALNDNLQDYEELKGVFANKAKAINSNRMKFQKQEKDLNNCSTTNSSNDTDENLLKQNKLKQIEKQYEHIEAQDLPTPSKVSQFSREIFAHLKQREKQIVINCNYTTEQEDISEQMRLVLVDWLVDVHFKLKMLQETLFIAIYIIDKYLSIVPIKRQKLQLIGITALFIASKYEEIYPPELKKFAEFTQNTCSRKDILQTEGEIICALNFQLTVPSANRFIEWYVRLSDFSPKDISLANYFIELTLLDTLFLKYSPSNIAASAIYMVNKLNKAQQCWPDLLEKDSGFQEKQLRPCAKDLIYIQQKQSISSVKAVVNKYSHSQFHRVGLMILNSKQETPQNKYQ